MLLTPSLILASQSPRRKKLLEQLGLAFEVQVSPVDEIMTPGEPPADLVQRLALEKAEPVAARRPDALTLAADTIVVLGEEVLGKPNGEAHARRMLRQLAGATHTVYTGLALVHPASARQATAVEATAVTFSDLTDDEIAAYVATGAPLDKAGAYGIQDDYGAVFVSRIDGDYYNVVGLPLHRFYRLLKTRFGDLIAAPTATS